MGLFLLNAITLRRLVNREWFWAISSVPSKRAVELLSPMRSACGGVRTFTGVHPVAETEGYLEQDERLWSQVFDLFHKERKSSHLIGWGKGKVTLTKREMQTDSFPQTFWDDPGSSYIFGHLHIFVLQRKRYAWAHGRDLSLRDLKNCTGSAY